MDGRPESQARVRGPSHKNGNGSEPTGGGQKKPGRFGPGEGESEANIETHNLKF